MPHAAYGQLAGSAPQVNKSKWTSFIGFLPASKPQVVVAAIVDEPRTVYGGVAAAPLFQDVARFAIQRLGIEAAPPIALPPHVRPAS